MKKIAFAVLFVLGFVVMGVAQQQFETVRFEGESITGIRSFGVFEIKIRQGENTGIKVSIPARYKDKLDVSRDADGKITLRIKVQNIAVKKSDRFTAEITCSTLNNIELFENCRLESFNSLALADLDVTLFGASELVMKDGSVNVGGNVDMKLYGVSKARTWVMARGSLNVDVFGSSEMDITGNASSADIEVNGTSVMKAGNLNVGDVKVGAYGSSEIDIAGNASSADFKLGGVSVIRAGNFSIGDVNVSTYGASDVYVCPQKSLEVKAYGSSSVSYILKEGLNVNVIEQSKAALFQAVKAPESSPVSE